MKTPLSAKFTVWLPVHVMARLEDEAQAEGRSINHMLNRYLSLGLGQVEPPPLMFGKREIKLVRHDDDAWITAEQVGEALEYAEKDAVLEIYRRNKEELDEYSCTLKMRVQSQNGVTQNREVRVFNEEGVMIICMLSQQPKAREFRRWAVEVLKRERRKPYRAAPRQLKLGGAE